MKDKIVYLIGDIKTETGIMRLAKIETLLKSKGFTVFNLASMPKLKDKILYDGCKGMIDVCDYVVVDTVISAVVSHISRAYNIGKPVYGFNEFLKQTAAKKE